jgi:HSP20 family molecular chaperone IbpA
MLNSLIRLLDDSNLENLENRLSAGIDRFKKVFRACFTSLEDKEDHYELVLDVAKEANAKNVTVDYDDETRELSVEYKFEGENFANRSSISETLPADADEDEIEATVADGTLTISIGKKPVASEEPEDEPGNTTIVKVNRKKK